MWKEYHPNILPSWLKIWKLLYKISFLAGIENEKFLLIPKVQIVPNWIFVVLGRYL